MLELRHQSQSNSSIKQKSLGFAMDARKKVRIVI